ncbi:MAG: alpha/beta hydrolase [Clostridia bacterium]|nr:alpha/beta hydrolase [Clostridia bacterium]
MKYLIIAALILAVLVLITVIILFAMSRRTFGRGKQYDVLKTLKNSPEIVKQIVADREIIKKLVPEEVSINSYDGLKLVAKLFYAKTPSNKFVVCMHGFHSGAVDDFAGAVEFFRSYGFNLLFVTQRCHGKSEGKRITFGYKERYDCRAWCEYLVSRFGGDIKIVLDGVSMGAATVVMASDREVGLPSNVRAVISDCGYTSPWEIVCKVAKQTYKLPTFPFLYLFRLVVKLDAGFDLKAVSSEKSAANTDIPIFFAHGTGDDFVPYEMSVRSYNAAKGEKYLFTSEGAGHGLSFVCEKERYSKECIDFIEKFLD